MRLKCSLAVLATVPACLYGYVEDEPGTTHYEEILKDATADIVSALPKNFMWGSATASYQVEGAWDEGGRGPSIWDTFSHLPGKVAHNEDGNLACDHYHRYPEDIAIMKRMGLTHFRMSISWSRVLPEGEGAVNQEGIDHYNKVIDMLLENDIVPFVTLYHWDLPQALEDKYGGWLSTDMVEPFKAFADICFNAFGDRVKHWLTFNEPWTFAHHGYLAGSHAPGRCSDRIMCPVGFGDVEPYLVAHSVLLSHAHAMELYKTKYAKEQGGIVGITLNGDWPEPLDNTPAAALASQRFNEFQFGWFGDPVFFGDYPSVMKRVVGDRLPKFTEPEKALFLKNIPTFFGLNHYSSVFVAPPPEFDMAEGWDRDMGTTVTYVDNRGREIGQTGESPWLHVVPWGFKKVLKWVHERYKVPIIVTENGCDVPGESMLPFPFVLRDPFRINYYKGYISAMNEAVAEGVDVRGYFAWSLLDNFEWADGYTKRFGLTYLDYGQGLKRTEKASAIWLSRLIAAYKVMVEGAGAASKQGIGESTVESFARVEEGKDEEAGAYARGGSPAASMLLACAAVAAVVVGVLAGFVVKTRRERAGHTKLPTMLSSSNLKDSGSHHSHSHKSNGTAEGRLAEADRLPDGNQHRYNHHHRTTTTTSSPPLGTYQSIPTSTTSSSSRY